MFRNVACRVGFYEQVEVPGDMVAGDGCVRADDLFLNGDAGVFGVGYGEGRCNGDVLAYWEAED